MYNITPQLVELSPSCKSFLGSLKELDEISSRDLDDFFLQFGKFDSKFFSSNRGWGLSPSIAGKKVTHCRRLSESNPAPNENAEKRFEV